MERCFGMLFLQALSLKKYEAEVLPTEGCDTPKIDATFSKVMCHQGQGKRFWISSHVLKLTLSGLDGGKQTSGQGAEQAAVSACLELRRLGAKVNQVASTPSMAILQELEQL